MNSPEQQSSGSLVDQPKSATAPAVHQFYYQVGSDTLGPVPPDQLQKLAASGKLGPKDLIRLGDTGKWKAAIHVKGLVFATGPTTTAPVAPSPTPPSAVPAPTGDKNQVFYQVGQEVIGPVSSRELKQLAASGVLQPSQNIRLGVNGKWSPANRIRGLKFATTSVPAKVSNSSAPAAPRKEKREKTAPVSREKKKKRTYYCRIGDVKVGPLNRQGLQELASSGRLHPTDRIRIGKEGRWKLATRFRNLKFEEAKEAKKTAYFCRIGNVPIGPLTVAKLQKMIENGRLHEEDPVRVGKTGKWRKAFRVEELTFPNQNRKDDESASAAESTKPSKSTKSGKGWLYCRIGTVPLGPLTPVQLQELATTGVLKEQHEVRKGEEGEWVPAIQVKGLTFPNVPTESQPSAQTKKANYYCKFGDEIQGPFTVRALSRFVGDGTLSANDMVRIGEAGQWVAAETIDELKFEPVEADEPDWEWYYQFGEQQMGPLTRAELYVMATTGQLAETDLVRHRRTGKWRPAAAVPGLIAQGTYDTGTESAEMNMLPYGAPGALFPGQFYPNYQPVIVQTTVVQAPDEGGKKYKPASPGLLTKTPEYSLPDPSLYAEDKNKEEAPKADAPKKPTGPSQTQQAAHSILSGTNKFSGVAYSAEKEDRVSPKTLKQAGQIAGGVVLLVLLWFGFSMLFGPTPVPLAFAEIQKVIGLFSGESEPTGQDLSEMQAAFTQAVPKIEQDLTSLQKSKPALESELAPCIRELLPKILDPTTEEKERKAKCGELNIKFMAAYKILYPPKKK